MTTQYDSGWLRENPSQPTQKQQRCKGSLSGYFYGTFNTCMSWR
ncbi:hypothetical protein VPMS16_417 [Vibrio sp. 16]|nr:hypothetical protein VPMS16_417 [Vibrio sp. 16]